MENIRPVLTLWGISFYNGHVIKKRDIVNKKKSKFWERRVWGDRVAVARGWKLQNHVLRGHSFPVHSFRNFCCRMYLLATVHFATDRQTTLWHFRAVGLVTEGAFGEWYSIRPSSVSSGNNCSVLSHTGYVNVIHIYVSWDQMMIDETKLSMM